MILKGHAPAYLVLVTQSNGQKRKQSSNNS